jgi:hypothetical protein
VKRTNILSKLLSQLLFLSNVEEIVMRVIGKLGTLMVKILIIIPVPVKMVTSIKL